MIDGKLLIEKLITYARAFLGLNDLDITYVKNTLLAEFKIESPIEDEFDLSFIKELSVPDTLFKEIYEYALENNLVEDEKYAELFANYIFGLLTPKPSEINTNFRYLREKMSAQSACDYLYNMSVMNNYIQKTAISKNILWTYEDKNNVLEITINLSKPEKDNKDIAKLLKATKSTKYPMCALCKENEGYFGNYSHPARANLRTVEISLGGEQWYMQYSPYAYFEEHCIMFNKEHRPMQMTRQTVEKLLDYIEIFPNYFIGSNSDLPIVGGSILNHEHYQGGKHQMPMHKAGVLYKLSSETYRDVEISILNWYNSVIRLEGYNRNTVSQLAGDVIEAWKVYSDENVSIYNSQEERHNTITPMARFLKDGKYCVELILRNNYQSEEYPDGVFHAHPEYFNIKKEGIGLIEAMGLYILPGRLKKQFEDMASILCGETEYNREELENSENPLYVHREMINSLVEKYGTVKNKNEANKIITNYVNNVCVNILYNTAVFKKDENGVLAFRKFLNVVGIK